MSTDARLDRAEELYERAVFGGDPSGLALAERDLDGVEADLTLARGRIMHGRFLHERNEDPRQLVLFERAARLYQELGDLRGEGEATFWIGIVHQVIRQDDATAVPLFARADELAARAGDPLTRSYALRHLGFAAHQAGRFDEARAQLEESLQLRRELDFQPGVAANLVGLAYVALAQHRVDDARDLVEEAGAIATASGAHGIGRQVDEARTALPARPTG